MAQACIVESQLGGLVTSQVIEHRIGNPGQIVQDSYPFRLSQVQCDASLVSVPGLKIKAVTGDFVGGHKPGYIPTCSRIFELDYLGSHIRKIQSSEWAGAKLRKSQYSYALQW